MRTEVQADGQPARSGEDLIVTVPYVGPVYNMRGNRPGMSVWSFGENFAGQQEIWVDPSTHIELDGFTYVCDDGSVDFPFYHSSPSWTQSGGIAGIRVDFNVWYDAFPVPFVIELSGEDIRNRCLDATFCAPRVSASPLS